MSGSGSNQSAMVPYIFSSSESPQSPTGGTPSRPSTCLARIPTATVETPHQPLLRRSTSGNSLYLTRWLSHTTTLDDTTKWEHVSKQVNSRFKAISDTWQLRMPRVPSINFPSFRPITGEKETAMSQEIPCPGRAPNQAKHVYNRKTQIAPRLTVLKIELIPSWPRRFLALLAM